MVELVQMVSLGSVAKTVGMGVAMALGDIEGRTEAQMERQEGLVEMAELQVLRLSLRLQ